jgi:hypothetical protein
MHVPSPAAEEQHRGRNRFRLPLAVLALASIASSSSPAAARFSDPELSQCANLSHIEIAADLILAIANADDKDTSVDRYLRNIFDRAPEAQRDYPTVLAPVASLGLAVQFEQMLSDFGFDRTSIQLRTLTRMRRSQPKGSQSLLSRLLSGGPSTIVGCGEVHIGYAGRGYYRTLFLLFPSDIQTVVASARRPQQLAGLLDEVSSTSGLPAAFYRRVAEQTVSVLSGTQVSDRVFEVLNTQLRLDQGFVSLGVV